MKHQDGFQEQIIQDFFTLDFSLFSQEFLQLWDNNYPSIEDVCHTSALESHVKCVLYIV